MGREIAEELYISVNTSGNHMRSILNKTNAANRTEAAHMPSGKGWSPMTVPPAIDARRFRK